jgi:hypothetical protein
MTDMHEYELTIKFVVSPNASGKDITTFAKELHGSSCLNAGDNEEGPFLHGLVRDVQITRTVLHD